MKRLTVLGLIALVVTASLLIGAGSWGDPQVIDPIPPTGVINAVVYSVSGNDTTIYFGELIKEPYVDRYLMVINSNVAGSSDSLDTLTLTLCPGPGTYRMILRIASGDSLFMDTIGDSTTNTAGQIQCSFILGMGGSALIHIDPRTPGSSFDTILSSSDSATYAVNGRKIAVDQWGRVHVCYNDVSSGVYSVWYARSDDMCTTWVKQKVADSAICPTIAVDTFGIPWISYLTHPDLQKLYLWSEGYDIEAIVVDLDDNTDSITNAPAVAINFEIDEGYGRGIACYSSKFTNRVGAVIFDLPSVDTVKTGHNGPREQLQGPLACTISPTGSSWIAGRNLVYNVDELKLYAQDLYETNGWWECSSGDIDGEHGDPSLARQGQEVWCAYYQPSSHTVRYKANSNNSFGFPSGDGTQIASLGSNNQGLSVQICENFPFIVWSNYNSSSSARKIYYTYRKIGDGTSWSTPARVSTTDTTVLERYPHVAHDPENKRVYVIWTQFGTGINTMINGKVFTYGDLGWDSVRVIHPNGPPPLTGDYFIPTSCYGYPVGETLQVVWDLDTSRAPDSTQIFASYNNGSSWETLGSTGNDTTIYNWIPQKTGEECLVKAKVWYSASDHPQDESDETFRIWGLAIHQHVFPGGPEPFITYNPPGLCTKTEWDAYSFNGLDTVDLQISVDGGDTYTSIGDSSTYDSTVIDTIYPDSDTLYGYHYSGVTYWTVPTQPTSAACMRLMAVDTVPDTAYSDPFDAFSIPPTDGFAYSTYSNQNMISINDDGDKIGFVYTGQDPDTATKLSVMYMESEEGLDFSAPDTVDQGCWPAFSAGACCWQNIEGDTLRYGYQQGDSFVVTTLHSIPQAFEEGQFAPVGILSVDDTAHMLFRETDAYKDIDNKPYSALRFIYLKFLETSPVSLFAVDTISNNIENDYSLYDSIKIAPVLVKRDSIVYGAYNALNYCALATILPSTSSSSAIGSGSYPDITLSEGNITYTYIGAGDTTLIRLWRYVDDTTWVERDTFYLDDDAEFLFGEGGLYYGVQYADTNLADIFTYDPISEEYYLTQSYTGYYPHPWIDDGASEFAWITAYADYVDSSTTYMHTERHDMNVILPALYLETDDKRSPYTVYRDTCIHYTSVDVDSGTDSLTYLFGNLDANEDYAVIVEFYTECDSSTELQVQVGTNLDTVQIPGNSFSWYEQDIASSSDTMALAVRRIGTNGFVPVSRVIVRRRSASGFFMALPGQREEGPLVIPFCLYQPYPNPFGDVANIRFSLPYATHVSLKVYDVSGRLVNRLVDGEVEAGVHEMRWEGKDNQNRKCASGVYFVRYQADEYQAAKKMVLIK